MTSSRLAGALIIVTVLAVGCGGATVTPAPVPSPDIPTGRSGGTLRVGMDIAGYEFFQVDDEETYNHAFDPQTTWAQEPWEIFRCCLLRTLLSYNGRSTADGGAELQPDLAAELPTISADGLTWTFKLKTNLHYAPPLADTPIVAADIIRALERTIGRDPLNEEPRRFGPYSHYFADVIVGTEEFSEGTVSSISGLEAPDSETLVIHLTQPVGDLGARLALPAAAPLPAGAADGHDTGYGPYLVASGPYMIEGAENLDPSLPADQQVPVSGYVPGSSLTLVRNPSWDSATDDLRGAFVDRIDFTQTDDYDLAMSQILEGELDLHFLFDLDPADISQLRADTETASQVHATSSITGDWITMNLAVPPFDDLHVRRAVNLITNKRALVELMNPGARIHGHAIPDALENDLLSEYNPYATVDDAGSVERARAEMAQSGYDSNGDGRCDASACAQIRVPVRSDGEEPQEAARQFAGQVAEIGIELVFEPVEVGEFYGAVFDPGSRTPLAFTVGWSSDFLNGSGWFGPLAASESVGSQETLNLSLIGATPEQLSNWGYSVTQVPSLDATIDSCMAQSGSAQFECWARTDQYVMERIAPWVPLDNRLAARVISDNVTQYHWDVPLTMPALDQIELAADE